MVDALDEEKDLSVMLEFLEKNNVFSVEVDLKRENDVLRDKVERLEKRLASARNHNDNLQEENNRLRARANDFEDKYRRLLGRYQIDVGKMTLPF